MVLELTKEEVDLLQEILVQMTDKSDWINTEVGYPQVYVLMDKDDVVVELAEKIDTIYSKLF